MLVNEESPNPEEQAPNRESQSLVRTAKSVQLRPDEGKAIDHRVVSPVLANCFNYSLFSKDQNGVGYSLAITSAHKGEGKTLVASNLAVSMAIAAERETVLVDFNVRHPKLHSVFGTNLSPGLVEALTNPTIYVSVTQVKHLYVLTAGNYGKTLLTNNQSPKGFVTSKTNGTFGPASLATLASFRDVVYSLQRDFDVIIIDMPAILDPEVPALATQHMNGLLLVVDSQKTTREDIANVFHRVGKQQVIGFVLNRVAEYK